jgi:hypothetical protein
MILILFFLFLTFNVVYADALGVKSGTYTLTLNDCPSFGESCTGSIGIGDKSVNFLDIVIEGYRFVTGQLYDLTQYFTDHIDPYSTSFYFLNSPYLADGGDVLVLTSAVSGQGSWWLGEAITCNYYPGICGILYGSGEPGSPPQGTWYNPKQVPEPFSLLLFVIGCAVVIGLRLRGEK